MKEKNTRPEAYPKPTVTDNQLSNQPEFIDEQLDDSQAKPVSDSPATDPERQSNGPIKDSERGGE